MGITQPAAAAPTLEPVSVPQLGMFFLKLGATGFGGPIALAGAMQRALVDERRWVTRDEFVEGLALAQLAPGPLAAQLAMYLGYLRGGVLGATVVAVAFVLPSFLLVWLIAAAYVRFNGLWWMQALFYGIGAAVIGIIARSVVKLSRLALGRDRLLVAIALTLAITTALTGRESVWLFVLSGFVPLIARRLVRPPAFVLLVPLSAASGLAPLSAASGLAPVSAAGPAVASTSLLSIGSFFAQAGAFVFGSGLAVVPFLYGGVVQERHWLTEQQFVDAVAVAMITPGPVVITVAFIGFLIRGVPGMTIAALAVFLPVYLIVVVAAPSFRRHHDRPAIKQFVGGVTAAATGAIAGAAVLLARRALVDPWTIGIAVSTTIIMWRWRVSELWLIAAAGVLGLCLR
jgi:chromate transporter